MSPLPQSVSNRLYGFPRVSGDEPIKARDWRSKDPFSPRERG